eukprot:TRINITY_DN1975_c0_g1_i2.p1 TRINITY_DN1975_c0_g1~~TRINITY_DN1975_c0_g1_i2.p1  ORF type:complete len:277 (-),score=68.62 TRINITY_DN1975_c0_g1_i2:35-865(-)
MSLENLIQRLEFVHERCGDPKARKKREEEEAKLDDFGRLKKQIARDVKDARQQIEERNQLLGETDNTVATAKMSSAIRTKLREIEADAERLKEIQLKHANKIEKKRAKGKEVPEEDLKESEYRTEIVDLCFKHIAECRHLEKTGHGANQNAFFDGYTNKDEKAVTSLPDIDDADFQVLRQKDAQIDAQLVLVGEGVTVLREMAQEMGKEIELQGVMLGELEHKVDKTNAELNNLNKRLKKTLEKVRKGDRFCLDILLLIIILAIGGYIYNIVRKKS